MQRVIIGLLPVRCGYRSGAADQRFVRLGLLDRCGGTRRREESDGEMVSMGVRANMLKPSVKRTIY